MTEDQLQEHGYPRANPEASGRAIIYNLPEKKPASDRETPRRFLFFFFNSRHQMKCYICFITLAVFIAFNKICCRCGAEYKVNANGNCVRKEECSFHFGQLRRQKGLMVPVMTKSPVVVFTISTSPCLVVAGGWETSYRCCAAAVGAPGCQVSKVLYLPSLSHDFCSESV